MLKGIMRYKMGQLKILFHDHFENDNWFAEFALINSYKLK